MTDTKKATPTMTKETLTQQLVGLVDQNKQFAFAAGLYASVMLKNKDGLYFGGLRKFVCEVFPGIAKTGNFGLWCPMLSTAVTTLIERKFIKVEEREPKKSKGNKPKFHVVADEEAIQNTIKGLEGHFGQAFADFIRQATDVYQAENSRDDGDWNKMANDFASFYA